MASGDGAVGGVNERPSARPRRGTVSVRTPARVGLLGNPSDGFGGRVIATTIDDFAATVTAAPATMWQIVDATGTTTEAPSIEALAAALPSLTEGGELLAAAVVRLAHHLGGADRTDEGATFDEPTPHRLSFTTTIPRQCGLSGSSAVIIAALRALAPNLPADVIALLALEAETRELGWTAGPQDRVVQSLGGPLDMDFSNGWKPTDWVRIAPQRLPPIVLAWYPTIGEASDVVHRDIRGRFDAGDEQVVGVMQAFAELASAGRRALDDDTASLVWPDLLDEAWNLRTELWSLADTDHALVAAARSHGIGASIAGSGGAVIGVPRDASALPAFIADLAALGATAIEPSIGRVVEP